MPAGDAYALESGAVSPLSEAQRFELGRVVEAARSVCGYGFGVFVGPLPDGRDSAIAHHAALALACMDALTWASSGRGCRLA